MSIEQNKTLATEFFAHLTAGDISAALELLTEDFSWLLPGKAEHFPTAGYYNKARIERLLQSMFNLLKDGLKLKVKNAIAEDSRVSLEVEGYGELLNGRIYEQNYHFYIEFRDGKISVIREYLDTQHAFAVWFQKSEEANPA